jgi:hypothetical protein
LAQREPFGKEERKKKEKREKNERKGLTLTGLLMEGVRSPVECFATFRTVVLVSS